MLLKVKEVLWLDQNTLFAIYTNEQDNDARIVKRPTKPECTIKYISLDDVAPIANDHRSLGCIEKSKLLHHGQKFYTHVIHNFGPDIKYAIIIANTISHNLMVVGCYQCQTIEEEDKENNENSGEAKGYWATWSCPSYVNHFYQNNKNSGDDQVIATSTAKTTTTTTTTAASSITCQRRAKSQLATFKCGNNSTESIHPVGMTVDYSTTPSGFAKTYDSATPMLYYITNAGMIKGYTVNRSDKPFFSMYDGMVPVVSPLNKIPSPTTTGQKQEGNREENEASSSLLTATYIPTREAYAEILKSHSPFADAVKRYEQNEQSLWKEHRNVPSFRTLGTKPNARSPTTYWYSSAKPKFGETSMPGFRFGTTPRFGDSGPTRFGVPFNEEKSSLTLATGQYSLYGPKKETVEQRASSTERVVLNLNVAAPKLIDNNKITRREYSFGRPFIQQNSFSSTSTTHSSDFGFTSMNNNNNTPVKTQHNHLTTVPSPVNSKATNTTNNQKSTLFHYNPKAEMKYKENVSNNTRIIGGFAALNEGFTTMTTASHLKESQAAVVLNDSGKIYKKKLFIKMIYGLKRITLSFIFFFFLLDIYILKQGENSSTSGPSLPQLCFCGKSGTHNHTSNNYNNIKSTKLEVTMDEKKTTSSSTRKNDNISIVPTSSTKPKDSNNTVQSNEIAHSSNPSQSTPSKVVGNVFGSGQTQGIIYRKKVIIVGYLLT
ncbi:hypothetical protein BDA99DRAFT_333925 [Phascolomyces articulosus]|uniref:Uncharacterized protein n=1 Tax=Phascolomyces articulosus TaxID=60185 RepID=A0AAD5JVT3_9FUNG|nr:hypothetical protein BDA99DRAFT_333925 [Phascolomyces articulosus]